MTDTPETTEPTRPDADADALDGIACVEALLFASDSPLAPTRIVQAAGLKVPSDVKHAIETLNARYAETGAAFTIEAVAGGYQMMTRPEYNDVLRRMHRAKADSHLSQAALEALAIVAYRQPILRADVEAIRGVACGEILRKLMEKQLVKIVGRAEVIGRPMLYGTTRRFLEVFGLKDLDGLPRVEELRQPIRGKEEPGDSLRTNDSPQAPADQAQAQSDATRGGQAAGADDNSEGAPVSTVEEQQDVS